MSPEDEADDYLRRVLESDEQEATADEIARLAAERARIRCVPRPASERGRVDVTLGT